MQYPLYLSLSVFFLSVHQKWNLLVPLEDFHYYSVFLVKFHGTLSTPRFAHTMAFGSI